MILVNQTATRWTLYVVGNREMLVGGLAGMISTA